MDIPNLDYTTKSYIYVKNEDHEKPAKYSWPRTITDAVASIVKKRLEKKNSKLDKSKKRNSLLRKMIKFEDEFVEGVCKTLI